MCRETLTVELRGGLGNQMFGVVTGIFLAQETGRDVRFTVSGANSNLADSVLGFGIEVNGMPASESRGLVGVARNATRSFVKWAGLNRNWFFRRLQFLFLGKDFIAGKSRDGVLERLLKTPRIRRVVGYFSTCDYFELLTVPPEEKFTITESDQSDWLKEKLAGAKLYRPMAVHIRQGDYLKLRDAQLSEEYYESALRIFESSNPDNPIWVFSDSPESARTNFAAIFENRSVSWVEPDNSISAAEVLYLISRCSGLIAANSTFSWWAAHLGDFELGVYAPEKGFARNPFRDCSHFKSFIPAKDEFR